MVTLAADSDRGIKNLENINNHPVPQRHIILEVSNINCLHDVTPDENKKTITEKIEMAAPPLTWQDHPVPCETAGFLVWPADELTFHAG